MTTLFETGSFADAGTGPLLLELGTGYCLLSQLGGKSNTPRFARLWAFADTDRDQSLQQILDTVEASGIARNKVRVALALPQCTVLPEPFSGKADLLLEALFPGQGSEARVFSARHHYVFVVPRAVNALLHAHFNEVLFVPAPACTPPAAEAGNSLQVFFIGSQFRLSAYAGEALLLQQQYSYTSALDVVYYLLKICSEFGFGQQDTLVLVSGFITADSALYAELHQYFLNIRFSELGTVAVSEDAVPRHYFSSLYNLALCAS